MIAFIDDHREANGGEPICKVPRITIQIVALHPSIYLVRAAKCTDPT